MSVWLFADEVAGTLAMWAIRQSPYDCPDNLELVVKAVRADWPCEIGPMKEWDSQDEIEECLQEITEQIPEFMLWNERKNGRDGMGFSSRYDQPTPDDDFIDLHALWRNVAMSLWKDNATESADPLTTPAIPS